MGADVKTAYLNEVSPAQLQQAIVFVGDDLDLDAVMPIVQQFENSIIVAKYHGACQDLAEIVSMQDWLAKGSPQLVEGHAAVIAVGNDIDVVDVAQSYARTFQHGLSIVHPNPVDIHARSVDRFGRKRSLLDIIDPSLGVRIVGAPYNVSPGEPAEKLSVPVVNDVEVNATGPVFVYVDLRAADLVRRKASASQAWLESVEKILKDANIEYVVGRPRAGSGSADIDRQISPMSAKDLKQNISAARMVISAGGPAIRYAAGTNGRLIYFNPLREGGMDLNTPRDGIERAYDEKTLRKIIDGVLPEPTRDQRLKSKLELFGKPVPVEEAQEPVHILAATINDVAPQAEAANESGALPVPVTRVAVFSRMPPKGYSGGRYHTWMMLEAMTHAGMDVTLITDHVPIFIKDFEDMPQHSRLKIWLTADFQTDLSDEPFDIVVLVPGMDRLPTLYQSAAQFAMQRDAHLVFLNFETPNWFNAVSTHPRDETLWQFWQAVSPFTSRIISTTRESQGHAVQWYRPLPEDNRHTSIYAAINTVAAEKSVGTPREKRVLFFFARAKYGEHKGSDILSTIISPAFKDHTLVFICGGDPFPEDLRDQIETAADLVDCDVEFLYNLDDEAKFREYRRATLLMFPSSFEGYGYPPLEALYCGTACVAYDLPVLRETCGDLLRYAPIGDAVTFGEAVADVLTNPPSLDHAFDRMVDVAGFENYSKRLAEMARSLGEEKTVWSNLGANYHERLQRINKTFHLPDLPVVSENLTWPDYNEYRPFSARFLMINIKSQANETIPVKPLEKQPPRILIYLRQYNMAPNRPERIWFDALIKQVVETGRNVDIVCHGPLTNDSLGGLPPYTRVLDIGQNTTKPKGDWEPLDAGTVAMLERMAVQYAYEAIFVDAPNLPATLSELKNFPPISVIACEFSLDKNANERIHSMIRMPSVDMVLTYQNDTGIEQDYPNGVVALDPDFYLLAREGRASPNNLKTRQIMINAGDDLVTFDTLRALLWRYGKFLDGATAPAKFVILGAASEDLQPCPVPCQFLPDKQLGVVADQLRKSCAFVDLAAQTTPGITARLASVLGVPSITVSAADAGPNPRAAAEAICMKIIDLIGNEEAWLDSQKAAVVAGEAHVCGPSPLGPVIQSMEWTVLEPSLKHGYRSAGRQWRQQEAELNEFANQVTDLDEAIVQSPRDIRVLWALAQLQADNNNIMVASEYLRRITRIDPGCAPAYLKIAELSLATADSEKAISILSKLLAQFPMEPAVRIALGRALNAMGRTGEAYGILESAHHLDSGNKEIILDCCLLAYSLDRKEHAKYYFRALASHKIDEDALDAGRALLLRAVTEKFGA